MCRNIIPKNAIYAVDCVETDPGHIAGPIRNGAAMHVRLGCGSLIAFHVRGCRVQLPSWLPGVGWTLHSKGYLTFTSRATRYGIPRNSYAHRVVVERLLGRKLTSDEIVHHMDFDKGNCMPCNLLLTSAEFNPSPARRDPYTGAFISIMQWFKNYGKPVEQPPDWVMGD